MFSNEYIYKVDKFICIKNTDKDNVIVCLHVDDMLILDNNDNMNKSTMKILTNKFNMKDLGVIDIIIRIKNSKSSHGLLLFQSLNVKKILNKLFYR